MNNPPYAIWIPATFAIIIILTIGYFVWDRPDQRSGAQKVGDAINALPDGVDKAVRKLEDRTPGEKIHDAAKDAKDDIKDFTNQR